MGAKVNGRIVPLKYTLRNGDVVEILTQAGHLPSKDWLALVKTSPRAQQDQARHQCHRARQGHRDRPEVSGEGSAPLGRCAEPRRKADLERVAGEYGYGKIEDLYAALGYGRFSARQVLQKLAPDQVPQEEPPEAPSPRPGAAPGQHGPQDTATSSSRSTAWTTCWSIAPSAATPSAAKPSWATSRAAKASPCTPRMCPNVQNLMYDVERKIDVEWARAVGDAFPVSVVIHTDDRPGMLNQLTSVLSDENTNIRSLEARSRRQAQRRRRVVEMTVDVRDKKQLEKLVAAMRRISGVRDVERATVNHVLRPRTHRHLQIEGRSRSIGKTAIAASTASGTCATNALAQVAPAPMERSLRRATTPSRGDRSVPDVPAHLRMNSVEQVGHYAIRILWNDGHNTGIYSYDHLRKICPCAECRAKAQAD